MKKLIVLMALVAFVVGAVGFVITTAQADAHKVMICHVPPGNPGKAKTIMIDPESVEDHLAHGDTLGACPE